MGRGRASECGARGTDKARRHCVGMGLDRQRNERGRIKRLTLATIGWVMFVVGPLIGLVVPVIPIGLVIFLVGTGLVFNNSERGKRWIQAASRWAEGRFPKLYGYMPKRVKTLLAED